MRTHHAVGNFVLPLDTMFASALAVDRRPQVAVGDAVIDGATLGGHVTLDGNGMPVAIDAGLEAPSYAKPLVYFAGRQFPQAVAGASLVASIAGYLFGGPLYALGGLVAGNLIGRGAAKYACRDEATDKDAACDQASAWGL